jgi:hypothetical protein
MRTAAGMGNLNGAYFCVKGTANQAIQKENELWKNLRILRKKISSYEWDKNPELNKIECQLKQSGTPMYLYNQSACLNQE